MLARMNKTALIDILTQTHEYQEFGRVQNKRSSRPDLHAFLLLNELIPSDHNIVAAAEHDEIYLAIGLDVLAERISAEQALELRRCGVRYHRGGDCLAMFT